MNNSTLTYCLATKMHEKCNQNTRPLFSLLATTGAGMVWLIPFNRRLTANNPWAMKSCLWSEMPNAIGQTGPGPDCRVPSCRGLRGVVRTAYSSILSYDRVFVSTQRWGKACSNKIFSFLKWLEFDQFYKKNFVAYTGAPVVGTPILGTHYTVSYDAEVCRAERELSRMIQGRMHWAVYFALLCFASGATLGWNITYTVVLVLLAAFLSRPHGCHRV